jgi:hypothetical protein
VDDPDRVLISPRDHQQYVLNPVPGMTSVLVYEKTGVDGKRQTASTMGTVAYMDEETIRNYVPKLK